MLSEEQVQEIRQVCPSSQSLGALGDLFKVLGEESRIRILSALSKQALCVCELTQVLGMKQSAVSQQLRILKAHRLVRYRREGRSMIYRLDDEHVEALYRLGLEHVQEKR